MKRKRKYPNAEEVADAVRHIESQGRQICYGEVGEHLETFKAVRAVGLHVVFRQRPELKKAYEDASKNLQPPVEG